MFTDQPAQTKNWCKNMIQSPVFIIGCPRSGTTLLFNVLSEVSSLWSIGYESKEIIEKFHHPAEKGWESGALDAGDVTPLSRAFILDAFEKQSASGDFWRRVNSLRDGLRKNSLYRAIKKKGRAADAVGALSSAIPQQGLDMVRTLVRLRNTILPFGKPSVVRLLEKTPENCLRLPFLLELFPDARVIYLTRDARPNVHSIMEGWRQVHAFPGYRVPEQIRIPGDVRGRWAFSLIPGWRELVDKSLEEVCAWQWVRCNEAVLTHRDQTRGRVPYLTLRYEDLVADPSQEFKKIADFIQVDFETSFRDFASGLPKINVVSDPDPDKWRKKNGAAIERILPIVQPVMDRLGYDSV
ncbi:MAG TPA: sulfotransferase [Anaerolineales bacterium]|nr:sulfotransferase [Anaerolineales bacterium]